VKNSFAGEVRDELAGLMPARTCCQIAELRGLFGAGRGRLANRGGALTAYFPALRNRVARKIMILARALDLQAAYHTTRSGGVGFRVEITLAEALAATFREPPFAPDERCDVKALTRGFFLSSGSVNAPGASYHLELTAPSQRWAEILAGLLSDEAVKAGITARGGRSLVYVKDGEGVVRTLSLMGASRAVMAFENARVQREVSAHVNRQLNFETANLSKIAGAGSRQLAAIRRLDASGSLSELPPALREAARLRLARPEASLTELAEALQLTRSGANHRLRRLEEAAARNMKVRQALDRLA
jgi:cell division protein WhiA